MDLCIFIDALFPASTIRCKCLCVPLSIIILTMLNAYVFFTIRHLQSGVCFPCFYFIRISFVFLCIPYTYIYRYIPIHIPYIPYIALHIHMYKYARTNASYTFYSFPTLRSGWVVCGCMNVVCVCVCVMRCIFVNVNVCIICATHNISFCVLAAKRDVRASVEVHLHSSAYV